MTVADGGRKQNRKKMTKTDQKKKSLKRIQIEKKRVLWSERSR